MTLDDILSRCEQHGECLLWTGPLYDGKYGGVYVDGVRRYTHRYVAELVGGPLADGEVVRHSCDNHRCCRPEHLLRGSQIDNMRDMAVRGRSRSSLSHETVREIRRLWETGRVSQSEIGRRLGVPQTTVSGICRGARWGRFE